MGRIKRIFNRFLLNRYRKLWLQIASALIIIISIPVVFLGVLLVNNSQRAVKDRVLANRKEIAVRTAREISLFLKHSADVLNTTAAMLGIVNSNPWQQETVLVELALDNPVFMKAASFDLSGKKIAGSDLGKGFSKNYAGDAIQKVLQDKVYISGVKFQDNNHIPYLTMAVGIKLKSKITGVLMADVDFRSLWEIIDGIRLDNTGRAFLVAADGTLLAHPDKKRVLRNENLKGEKDVEAVLSGRDEAITLEDNNAKKWVSASALIPATGWGLVLRQERPEAYLFYRALYLQLLAIVILIEIIAILSAIAIARVFAGSIKNFSTIAEVAKWITHGLKNSLAPIKSFVQLLPAKHTDGKFIDKFSDVVPEEIKRCERMLKELSDFSSFELKTERINIRDIMDGVLKIMQEEFIGSGIKVQFYAKDSDFYTWGDSERVKQVFTNLIINAIDAMPQGGALNISMSLILPAHKNKIPYIEINIHDTGTGIPEDRLKNIFEPFKTTKKDGMGLGLAISRKIVEQHRGDIQVNSYIGKGTAFTIKFPASVSAF